MACRGDDDPIYVCGCGGVLYDAVFPLGAHLVKKNNYEILFDKFMDFADEHF